MVVDAILHLFQQRTNDNLASEISNIKHSENDGDAKGNLGTGLMALLKEANSDLLLEEQGNGENQAMVDMIGRLVNLLLVFPLEYYAKHQRKSVVWLCFLADAWLWSNGRANVVSLLRGSLACRSVSLRFVHTVNAGILVSREREGRTTWEDDAWLTCFPFKASRCCHSSLVGEYPGCKPDKQE
jgi:hypothetical protein